MAQKIGDVRAELAEVQEDYAEALDSIREIIDTAERLHNDNHTWSFRNCADKMCQLIVEPGDDWAEVLP
jgi:hypothetical protein